MDLYEVVRTCTANGEHRTETAYVVASGIVQALQTHATRIAFDGRIMSIRLVEADVVVEEPEVADDPVPAYGFRVDPPQDDPSD